MNRARDRLSLRARQPAGDGPGRTGVLLQHRRARLCRRSYARPPDARSTNSRAAALFEPLGISASSGMASRATPTPAAACACARATWRRSDSSSWRAAAGMAARSCRRPGSTPRRRRIIKATDDNDYGYLWWLGRAPFNGREVRWIGALGRGGQSIRIVPELDLVVAVTAGYYQDYSPQAFKVQSGVFSDVLQAISPPG